MRYSEFVRVQIRFRDFSFEFASVHLSCTSNVRSKIQFTRNESNDSFYECSFGESFSEVSQTTVTQHKFLIFILSTSLYREKMKKEFERLPRNVVPNFYHLDINPSFETFKEGMKLTLIHHPL